MTQLEELKQEYLKDPVAHIKQHNEDAKEFNCGCAIKKVVFVEDNKIFTTLSNNLEWWSQFDMDECEVDVINSQVEDEVYISNRIKLGFKNNIGVITLTPEKDGICISKVILNPYMGVKRGTGSVFMGQLYRWILDTLNDFPPMYLECMGRINWGNQMFEYPYSLQTKFFRKFGFRVVDFKKGNGKNVNNYCQMKFFKEKYK